LPKWAWQNNKCPKLREKLEMEISEEKDFLRKPFCHINTMGDGNGQNSSLIEQPIKYKENKK
jgi:hypothetical protein